MKNSPNHVCVNIFNKLPLEFKAELRLKPFKYKLKKHITRLNPYTLEKYFESDYPIKKPDDHGVMRYHRNVGQ